jgi:hypothetical protein
MTNDSLDDIDLAALNPMTTEEALAVLDGEDLDVHRAQRLEHEEIAEEAERYRLVSPSEWPSLEFNWDFSADAQRFTLDGCKPDSFAKCFPLGLRLGWVSLPEFDAKLSLRNRRELAELWDVGDQGKLAMAIAYIRRGKPITPPLVTPIPAEKQVCLGGGNHRYTVAKFSGQVELPIYVNPEEAEKIAAIVTIRWA